MTEACWEQELKSSGSSFIFILGKIDLTNYFDTNEVANDETTQFLSSGFINNFAVEWPDDKGFGARFTFKPNNSFYISVIDADGNWVRYI